MKIYPDIPDLGCMSDLPAARADPFQLGRRPALDGMRGVAVLMVFLFHFQVPFASGGLIGVDVFFVLSGFLITALLCEEWDRNGRIDFLAFYQRRAVRLLPALVVLVGVLIACEFLLRRPDWAALLKQAAAALFYSMNWFLAYGKLPGGSQLSHTWSLSIEEQFYLLWPLILFVLLRLRNRQLLVALVIAGILSSGAARAIRWQFHHDWVRVYCGLDTRADGLLTGCALGALLNANLLPRTDWALAVVRVLSWAGVAYLIYVTALPPGHTFQFFAGIPLINLSVALVVLAMMSLPTSRLRTALEWNVLCWVGRISYGIYLWHWPIRIFLDRFRLDQTVAKVALGLGLTLGAAGASYYGVERYFLKRKKSGGRPASDAATLPATSQG